MMDGQRCGSPVLHVLIIFVILKCMLLCTVGSRPYFRVRQLSTVTNLEITEVSGMAASRTHQDILYVHNDSGDGPYIYAINATTGMVVSTIKIEGAIHNDWEDMAYGICPGHGYCIYIGDVGGNLPGGSRDTIYRVQEPRELHKNLTVKIDASLQFEWNEPDCEIIMVDPRGELYLVSKNTGIPAKVVKIPMYGWNNKSKLNLTDLVSMTFHTKYPDPTGGDISPDGTEVVIVSIEHLYYWKVKDENYLTALTSEPTYLNYTDEPQGEAVCWDPDGNGFYTLSEGINQPIYYYERLLNENSSADSIQKHTISWKILILCTGYLTQITKLH